MKTRHHTEEALLRLVDAGSDGDPHLAVCPACRERFRFLQQFEQALAGQRSRPIHPRIQQLLESWQEGKLVRLQPYTPIPDRPKTGPGVELIILAAQGEKKSSGRFEVVGTFSAIPQKMLLRVEFDHEKKQAILHLLTENPVESRRARIIIGTPSGGQFIASTNDNGIAVLEGELPSFWTDLVIAVSPSQANE
jgi:hypothetical protein